MSTTTPPTQQELRNRRNDRDDEYAAHSGELLADDQMSIVVGTDKDSPGVLRIKAITSLWTTKNKMIFMAALLVLTYCRSLAATVMGTYQAFALNEWGVAGKSGLIRTVRQVLTSSTLPITAKLSDYIGRTFMLNLTVLCWIVGPILVATSTGLGMYIPGFLLYTLGHVAGNILNYALAVDTTTLRNRMFLQFAYVFPSIINVWASGVVAAKVTDDSGPGWRWGAGMWAIIIPVASVGLVSVIGHGSLKARRAGLMEGIPSAWNLLRSGRRWKHLFWVMDIPGLTMLAGALACILLPLALGGGSAAKWQTAETIVPLVIGVLLLPLFALWESKYARHPIFPFQHMKDRHVMAIIVLNLLRNIAGSTRDAYMYFTLVVSFAQSTEGATRINTLEGFASSLTVIVVAFIMRRFRVVKPLIVAGVIINTAAQGMLVHYRGGYSRSHLAGLIAGEILDGIGTGMSSHPSLVAMQAKLKHEHALLVTSCWAVGSQAGGGVAAAISGAIWTNMMPKKLLQGLEAAGVPNAAKLAQQVYRSPLNFVKEFPPGSPAREAVVFAYRDVQRILCIIGVVLSAALIPITLLIDNVTLEDKTTLIDSDSDSELGPTRVNSRAEKRDYPDMEGEKQVKTSGPA